MLGEVGRGRVVFSTVVFDGDAGKFGKNPNFTSTSFEKEAKGNSEMAYSSICSDEGLTPEMPAFQIFHGGKSIFINSFDKTRFSCFSLPTKQHRSFFRK